MISLLVIRPLALALSLLGTRLRWQSVAFVAWFGPRVLVTIIFVLLALESLEPAEMGRRVIPTAALTVMLSVIAHGITAEPLASRYPHGRPASSQKWNSKTPPSPRSEARGADADWV